MGSSRAKWGILLGAGTTVFGVTIALGLKLLPSPHNETDYLVVGCAATFVSLGVVFLVLLNTQIRPQPALKPSTEPEPGGVGRGEKPPGS